MMTILIHSSLLACEINSNKIDKIKSQTIINQSIFILVREIMYGLFQCAKILFHYNYDNVNDFVLQE